MDTINKHKKSFLLYLPLITLFFYWTVSLKGQVSQLTSFPGVDDGIDIHPNSRSASLNGKWLFSGRKGGEFELFVTDGTLTGTYPLLNENHKRVLNPNKFYRVGDKIIFFSNEELYVSDCTISGTRSIKELNRLFGVWPLAIINNKFYFSYVIKVSDMYYPGRLYITDGTSDGSHFVIDSSGSEIWEPYPPIQFDSIVLFTANINSIWRSDNTPKGTYKITPINIKSYYIPNLVKFGNKAYLSAYTQNHGNELWVSDGTALGTHLYQDIWIGPISSNPKILHSDDDAMLFSVNDKINRNELWILKKNDTIAKFLADVHLGGGEARFPLFVTKVNDEYLILAKTLSYGIEFYTINSDNQVKIIKDINPGQGDIEIKSRIIKEGNYYYFTADSPQYGNAIWRTDGTVSGTSMFYELLPGPQSATPVIRAFFEDKFLFTATTVSDGNELYVFDEQFNKIDKSYNNHLISIYPNPATNSLSINTQFEITDLTILDEQGKIVLNPYIKLNQKTVNIQQLSPGIYILNLKVLGHYITKLFIKI